MAMYHLLVKPGSAKEGVFEEADGSLLVRTRKKAHGGEANAAVVEMLADYFGVGKTKVRIIRGANSRRKSVEVEQG